MVDIVTFPREMTAARVLPLRGTIYAEARKIALSAGADWDRMLGAAQTLSHSPDWTDMQLARHIRDAYSLHLAGLLNPVDPRHRDRSDMVDGWKEAALAAEAEETPLRVAMRHRPELLAILTGLLTGALVAVAFGAVVL